MFEKDQIVKTNEAFNLKQYVWHGSQTAIVERPSSL
jgi:hypothetical protein